MKPLAIEEILDAEAYEAVRDAFRRAVIEHKRNRRLPVGDRVSLIFEDRETLRFQVQEMLRAERTRTAEGIQHELDVYNELMPGEDELSATLMIEITDAVEIRPELDRLIGLDEHVALVLGEGGGEETIRATFDPRQMEEDRIAAVQYVRFPLGAEGARRFRDPDVPARVRLSHPHYAHQAGIPAPMRESLIRDLEDATPPLLDVAHSAGPRPR